MQTAGLVWLYIVGSFVVVIVCFYLLIGSDKPEDAEVKPIFCSVLALLASLAIYILWTYGYPVVFQELHK